MLNRPVPFFGSGDDSGETGWNADRDPQFRLTLLWLFLALPVLVVIGRVGQLQLDLQDDFAAAFSRTTETFQEIPARDGRILAADGSVLAGDVERYDVAVHYREIQDPPDNDWIASKARYRLSKADRKDKVKLNEEKGKVIAERELLWQKLADLAGRPLNDLLESRKKQQTRVERIKESVQRRYRQRHQKTQSNDALVERTTEFSWNAFWERIQQAISEPPEQSDSLRVIEDEENYHSVIANIDAEMKAEIEGHPERYPYTKILTHSHRTYPKGEFAAHLIGFRKPLSEEQLQKRRETYPDGDPLDYHVGDPSGVSGLELSYDSHLKGVRGRQSLIKNWRDEIVDTRIVRPPQHGRDLVLTLDSEVQLRAEQLLDQALTKVTLKGTVDPETSHGRFRDPTCPQGGCLVAIDVHTGAILAAAAAPRFDLNLMVSPDSDQWDDVMSDPRSPFLSRATQMALPPGSVFKVISAVASIDSGKMPPHETFYCQGYLDSTDKHRCLPFRHYGVGHGEVTLADALCRSCNVYFYTAARRMGPQTLVDWARRFGIGQKTGVDLPSESAGYLPAPDLPLAPGERRPAWRPGDTLDLAIGQSKLMVTPLQIVRAMAAVANGGNLVTPHLAAESGPSLMDSSSSIRSSPSNLQPSSIEGLHEETLDNIREGLRMVVHHPRGTGYKTVRMKEVTIAGKTGTAETNGIDHAWFAGYVPAEQPRIAFVVVLQNGGGGGAAAGPVAHEFVKKLVELGLVTKVPNLVSERDSTRHSQKR